jgi:hypothetical protein
MIRANCRDRFTAEDFNFIVKTLGKSRASSVCLSELLTDPLLRDQILDHELLLQGVLNDHGRLSISPQFYFYILTSDYIASLLEAFSRTALLNAPSGTEGNPVEYLSDMLLALHHASPVQVFLIRAHLGNYSLFLTGVFHENVLRRVERRGAPDFSYYEELGSMSFKVVANHEVARTCELSEVYTALSDRFREIRLALNRLSDCLINLDDDSKVPFLG